MPTLSTVLGYTACAPVHSYLGAGPRPSQRDSARDGSYATLC